MTHTSTSNGSGSPSENREVSKGSDINELKHVRNLFETLSDEERVLAVATALLNQSNSGQFEVLMNRVSESINFANRLIEILEKSIEPSPQKKELHKGVDEVFNAATAPRSRQNRTGEDVPTTLKNIDSIIGNIERLLELEGMLSQGIIRFKSNITKITETLKEEVTTVENLREVNNDLSNAIQGVLWVVEYTQNGIEIVSAVVKSVVDTIWGEDQMLRKRYLSEKSTKEDDAPKSIFDLLFGDKKDDTPAPPVFKDNIYLTQFLFDLYNKIPELAAGQSIDKVNEAGIEAFGQILENSADPKALDRIEEKSPYFEFEKAIKNFYDLMLALHKSVNDSKLMELLGENPVSNQNVYKQLINRHQRKSQPDKKAEDIADVKIKQICALIQKITAKPEETESKEQDQSKKLNERDINMLSIFQKLHETITSICENGEMEEEDLREIVISLIEEKSNAATPEKRRKDSKLKNDIANDNHAYEVNKDGDHEGLELKRVPTENVQYTDVIGASWSQVRSNMRRLLQYEDYGYVYSHMTARGRTNNNMIIIGPYGCGKNMFVKALMADPAVIGVSTTTDRLLSMWHSRSEDNTRKLFESAYEKRCEVNKPAVIGWDEFDSLYAARDNIGGNLGDIFIRMQKNLQSLLDGDVFYEGVNLIAMTNEPHKIPVPVYRRFAFVEVIEPLKDDERTSLMMSLLASLPVSENFSDNVNWDMFHQKTEYASGDVIGKIYDEVFNSFTRTLEGDQLKAINSEVRTLVMSGVNPNVETRRDIFQRHSDVVITSEVFESALALTLSKEDVQGAIVQQEKFYSGVRQLLRDAFKGVL